MIDTLGIGPDDDVVEMSPGLRRTTTLALAGQPRSCMALNPDKPKPPAPP